MSKEITGDDTLLGNIRDAITAITEGSEDKNWKDMTG